jgi:hypothetical protein
MIDQQLNQRDVPQMARDVTEPFRLGRALLMLGSRESETAHLQEATKAYRAALKEMTRDREPLSWAHLQSLLGVAFLTLGERESGTARLKEAVTAFRNAHKEYTRDRAPLEWAVVQTGLATALATQLSPVLRSRHGPSPMRCRSGGRSLPVPLVHEQSAFDGAAERPRASRAASC